MGWRLEGQRLAGRLGWRHWWGMWLVWRVFGMAHRYRTEPKLHNTGNTYTTKYRIRIGIDRTARLQPCLLHHLILGACREGTDDDIRHQSTK